MSEEKLLDAFGQIEEAFIEEAAPNKRRATVGKRGSNHWIKWGTYAACAVVVLGIGVPLALSMYQGSVKKGINNTGTKDVPEALQGNEIQTATEENRPENSEITEGLKDSWTVCFNEVTDVLDSARAYIPGYFTEELSEEDIMAIEPDMRMDWMQYSGYAGFDGEGKLMDVRLNVTTTMPGECITITISENDFGCCYILDEEAVISVCNDVEYTISEWDTGEQVVLAADAEINGYSYDFSLTTMDQDVEQAKADFTRVLECFAHYPDGKPELSVIAAEVVPEWFDKPLTYQEALEDQEYGTYMLQKNPKGFTPESIRRYKDYHSDYLSGLWTKGYDELRWVVYTFSESDEKRLTSVEDTENYDLKLYPIPRASSVPDELREIVDNPIFHAEELTQEVVWSRAYQVQDSGDSNGWRMAFSVKYGDTVVEIRGKGVDPEWIYQQLEALNKE